MIKNKYLVLLAFLAVNINAVKLFNSNNFTVSQETINVVDPILQSSELDQNLNIILLKYEDTSKLAFSYRFGTPEGLALYNKEEIAKSNIIFVFNNFLIIEEDKFKSLSQDEQKYWLYNAIYYIKNNTKIEKIRIKLGLVGLSGLALAIYKSYNKQCATENKFSKIKDKSIELFKFAVPSIVVTNLIDFIYRQKQQSNADEYAYSNIKNLDAIKSALQKSDKSNKLNKIKDFFGLSVSKRIEKLKKKFNL